MILELEIQSSSYFFVQPKVLFKMLILYCSDFVCLCFVCCFFFSHFDFSNPSQIFFHGKLLGSLIKALKIAGLVLKEVHPILICRSSSNSPANHDDKTNIKLDQRNTYT